MAGRICPAAVVDTDAASRNGSKASVILSLLDDDQGNLEEIARLEFIWICSTSLELSQLNDFFVIFSFHICPEEIALF